MEKEPNKHVFKSDILTNHKYFWLLAFVSVAACLHSTPVYADLIFSHPSEDNQTENLTLASGSYTFTTDANPNGYHWVEWYDTYSEGSPVATAHLYYYDDTNFNLTASGWVRAEIYKSDIFGNWLGWEASYRWYVTVTVPKEDTRISWVRVSPNPLIQYIGGSLGAKLTKDDLWNTDIPGKIIKFYVNGTYVGYDIGDSDGESWMPYTPNSSGPITVRAVFEGDSTYNPCEKTESFIVTPETISKPGTPSGPSEGETGQSLTFSTSGSSINTNHTLEYRFDWGDGTISSWGSSTQSHSYSTPGTKYVTAQARCATHTSVTSEWSSSKSVSIERPRSGYINSADPDTFTGSARTVTVTVTNTGRDDNNLIVVCDSFPSGWSVSPGSKQTNVPYNTTNSTYFTFTVTPPSGSDSSGIIIWELYYDDFVLPNTLLDTENQEVSNIDPLPTVVRLNPSESQATFMYKNSITFSARGEDDGGDLVSVDWVLDGPHDEHDEKHVSYINTPQQESTFDHTFDYCGDYTVTCTFSDNSGDMASISWDIFVGNEGNINAQEYGDAVYREIESTFFGFEWYPVKGKDHTALFSGVQGNSDTKKAIEVGTDLLFIYYALDAQLSVPIIRNIDFSTMTSSSDLRYWGAYTLTSNAPQRPTIFEERKTIVQTAITLIGKDIGYAGALRLGVAITPDCMRYISGTEGQIDTEEILDLRCDGLIEYCYEKNGFNVWGREGQNYNISQSTSYCDEHNNFFEGIPPQNPDTELAPVVQRGAAGGTSTFLTQPAEIDYPTYTPDTIQVGDEVHIDIIAQDQSGIHRIDYSINESGDPWQYSVVNFQHPDNDELRESFWVSSSCDIYYQVMDNGGNVGDIETIHIEVSEPIAPIILSISDESTTAGIPYAGPFPDLQQGTLPIEWSLVQGPDGMTIDSASGVVSWPNPIIVGSPHIITIRASNSAGYDDESWELTVTGDPPEKAIILNPTIGETGVPIDTLIGWSNGGGATSYDVYFGTDNPPTNIANGINQTGMTFDPGTLSYDTTYYWRIDAKNSFGTTEGDLWNFTTELGPIVPDPEPDINSDGTVNFADFAILASQFPNTGCGEVGGWCDGADVDYSGTVNFEDLRIIAEHWLEGAIQQNEPDGMVWVYINDPGVPGHEAFNGDMSKYETTNAQYCQFLNAALVSGDITVGVDNIVYGAIGSNSGVDFDGEIYFETYAADSYSQIDYSGGEFTVRVRDGYDMSNHPVVCVSWYGATAFCNYYGFRLPTEWEWQAVADYDGTFIYGCGTTVDQSKANYRDEIDGYANPLALSNWPYTNPVNYYPSYGYGMNDVAGNVGELTSSILLIELNERCVLRSSAWDTPEHYCLVTARHYPALWTLSCDIGFRVCREIPTNDVVAYWSFDEGSGTTLTDDSGKGHDGSISGATWVDGVSGKALSFDGSDDYVGLPSSNSLSFNTPSEPFSTSFWIKPDTITPIIQAILENEDDYLVSLDEGLLRYRKTDSGNLYHNVWQSTNNEISAGNWSHIAITYDGTGADGTKMYVNGEEIPVTTHAYHGGGSASGDDFAIGIRAFDFASNPYGGEIDEVRIYNRALTYSEIEHLNQNP